MKKVLMIASESSHFANFHIPYIDAAIDAGYSVFTAANGRFEHKGTTHIMLGFKKRFVSIANLKVIVSLVKLIKREHFDVVYTNSTLAGFVGRAAVILSGIGSACVHICHGYLFSDDVSLRSRIYLLFEKLTSKRTDLLAVMNKEDLEIARKYSLGKKIVFINGMGLDISRFPDISGEELSKERERLGAGKGETVFLCVGEFSKRKNQRCIIEAFTKLKRDDCLLVFAGEGAELDECKSLAAATGKRIVFLGQCKNVNVLYRASDCLISASRFEGLPFNVMEAMYCGCAVIASDVKGNRDLGGILYPYNNSAALTSLMEEFSSNLPRESLPERFILGNVKDENIRLLFME